MSEWFTEIESLLEHAPETTGYTFRLTGGKGEVLYGFCVAIMWEVVVAKDTVASSGPKSDVDGVASGNFSEGPALSSGKEDKADTTTAVAPRCYCFTTKFPFYRFHFAVRTL